MYHIIAIRNLTTSSAICPFELNNGIRLRRTEGEADTGYRPVRRAALIRMLIAMTIPLTGTQYEIEAGDYGATVTELGAGLRGLRFGDTYLVTSFDADELPPHAPASC